MKVFELPNNTKTGYAFTHKVIITKDDLTNTTNTQTLSLFPVKAGTVITSAAHKLVTEFTHADMATLTYTLGNTASATSLMDSTSVRAGVSPIAFKAKTTGPAVMINAASQSVVAAFTGESAKNISQLTAGEIHLYLQVADVTAI
jgi:hypothetical protein